MDNGLAIDYINMGGIIVLNVFKKLFARNNSALIDARLIYLTLLKQSRKTMFYGYEKANDNYDGRIDILTLHISIVLKSLRRYDVNGKLLSQALFDVMRDDFEIAMREEGLSDTGIKRRIKPMMQLFYTRVKLYVGALEENNFELFQDSFRKNYNIASGKFPKEISDYAFSFNSNCSDLSLGQIAKAEFVFLDF